MMNLLILGWKHHVPSHGKSVVCRRLRLAFRNSRRYPDYRPREGIMCLAYLLWVAHDHSQCRVIRSTPLKGKTTTANAFLTKNVLCSTLLYSMPCRALSQAIIA